MTVHQLEDADTESWFRLSGSPKPVLPSRCGGSVGSDHEGRLAAGAGGGQVSESAAASLLPGSRSRRPGFGLLSRLQVSPPAVGEDGAFWGQTFLPSLIAAQVFLLR